MIFEPQYVLLIFYKSKCLAYIERMAHRVQKIRKVRKVEEDEEEDRKQVDTSEIQNDTKPNFTMGKPSSQAQKKPRPILPSQNQIAVVDRNAFNKQMPILLPPDSLFKCNNIYDAGPQFLRPISYVIPNSPKKTNLPLGAWISPFGSSRVHTVQVESPLRCQRCKAYVNPFFQIDGTRTAATCNICGMRFPIPPAIDQNNLTSAQLSSQGVCDLEVKTKQYFRKRTDIIKVIIAIEMSQAMIELGVFGNVIQSIKSAVENNQFEDKIRIGIVYFQESSVTFLKLKKKQENTQQQQSQSFGKPIEYEVKIHPNASYCCPLSDEQFLMDPNNEKERAIELLNEIYRRAQNYYKNGSYQNQTSYVAALMCLQQSFQDQTGRIMLFSSLDHRYPGKFTIRERTEQETKQTTILRPIHHDYEKLADDLLKGRIGVDHFVFGKDAVISHELATTHFIPSRTGGKIYYYGSYCAQNHSENLYYSVYTVLTKNYVYDVDYTCRVSNGFNVHHFGTFEGTKQARDVPLSMMDPTSSVSVVIEHEEKYQYQVQQGSGAYLQFAIIFTKGSGQRVIRLINFRYQVTSKLQAVYSGADPLAFANILTRNYVCKLYKSDPVAVRKELLNELAAILAEYRLKVCPNSNKYSELMLPPRLGSALAYLHSVFSSKLLMNSMKLSPDSRITQIQKINSMDFYSFSMRYYPRLYPLTMEIYDADILPGDFLDEGDADEEIAILPPNLPLTKSSLKDDGVYLLNNGEYLVMFVMYGVQQELMMDLFGTEDWEYIEENGLAQLETSHNIRVHNIINELRRRNSKMNGIYLPLLIRTPRRKGPFNQLVFTSMKEDYHQCDYHGFLDHLHRMIQGFSK